jgi:DNA-binding LytR/AlgR family response regulator
MLKIAVVEDGRSDRLRVEGCLDRLGGEMGEKFAVSSFTSGLSFLQTLKNSPATGSGTGCDIILMDIIMPGLDGMKTAESIRQTDANVVIIFITSSSQFAIKGYAVDAFDYILTPLQYAPFARTLKRAIARLKTREKTCVLTVKTGDETRVIDLKTLYYREVNGHEIVFHTVGGNITGRGTLRAVEQDINEAGGGDGAVRFVVPNKGLLVNVSYIEDIGQDFLVTAGTRLPLSRLRKSEVLDAFNNHFHEVRK